MSKPQTTESMRGIQTIDERVADDGIGMIVQNVGRQRHEDGVYSDLWSCTLGFPDDGSDLFWINTGQTVRLMSGVLFGGSIADQGREKHPDIESVLQMLCKDAVDVENSDGRFEAWQDDALQLDSVLSKEDLMRQTTIYRQMQRHTEQLRDFLGAKFDVYLNKTEWTR